MTDKQVSIVSLLGIALIALWIIVSAQPAYDVDGYSYSGDALAELVQLEQLCNAKEALSIAWVECDRIANMELYEHVLLQHGVSANDARIVQESLYKASHDLAAWQG